MAMAKWSGGLPDVLDSLVDYFGDLLRNRCVEVYGKDDLASIFVIDKHRSLGSSVPMSIRINSDCIELTLVVDRHNVRNHVFDLSDSRSVYKACDLVEEHLKTLNMARDHRGNS